MRMLTDRPLAYTTSGQNVPNDIEVINEQWIAKQLLGRRRMMMDQAENLRNIIEQQNQNSITNARVIAVTSGKGGVGKSNLSVNLALEFTRMGKESNNT